MNILYIIEHILYLTDTFGIGFDFVVSIEVKVITLSSFTFSGYILCL